MFCERYDMKSIDKADTMCILTVQIKVSLIYFIHVCTLIKYAILNRNYFFRSFYLRL